MKRNDFIIKGNVIMADFMEYKKTKLYPKRKKCNIFIYSIPEFPYQEYEYDSCYDSIEYENDSLLFNCDLNWLYLVIKKLTTTANVKFNLEINNDNGNIIVTNTLTGNLIDIKYDESEFKINNPIELYWYTVLQIIKRIA